MHEKSILAFAREYVAAGYSVISVKRDGSKSPVEKWSQYQDRQATEPELERMFGANSVGIGLIQGGVSRNGIVFDIEDMETYQRWCNLIDEAGLTAVLDRCARVSTPGGGVHAYVQLTRTPPAGTQLAKRPIAGQKPQLLAETRGEGNYVVAPGSPADCHPTNRPYELMSGSPAIQDTATLSDTEFDTMMALLRSLDEMPEGTDTKSPKSKYSNHAAVLEYNHDCDVEDLLSSSGYALKKESGEVSYWQKPDSSGSCWHMTFNYKNSRKLRNFSGKNDPFEENTSYSAFEVRTFLRHNGDYDAALKSLMDEGYGKKQGKQPPFTVRLTELAAERAELWHDQDGDGYATVVVNGHNENYKMDSPKFAGWLRSLAYAELGAVPAEDMIKTVIRTVEQRSLQGACCTPALRIAQHKDKIYLDLCNEARDVVEIGPDGWEIVSDPPVKFIRKRAMRALPTPVRGGSLDSYLDLINVTDDQSRILLVGFILCLFQPKGPYPVLILTGQQGSAKTTAVKLIRMMVDPSEALLRSLPRDDEQVFLWAHNGWVIAIDNVSSIQHWLSDVICRLSTGGGYSVRRKYTAEDETIFSDQRPVILNGIGDIATKGDLLDRAIVLTLKKIADDGRLTEDEVMSKAEAAWPGALGSVLDVVSTIIRDLPTTRPTGLPRMADSARWVTAAEQSLGWTPGKFIEAFASNRRDAVEICLDASPLVQVIAGVTESSPFLGTPTELLNRMSDWIIANHSNVKMPRNASVLGTEMRRLAPALEAVGYYVEFGPGKHRWIRIVNPKEPADATGKPSKSKDLLS